MQLTQAAKCLLAKCLLAASKRGPVHVCAQMCAASYPGAGLLERRSIRGARNRQPEPDQLRASRLKTLGLHLLVRSGATGALL